MEIKHNSEQKDELITSAHHHAKPMLGAVRFRILNLYAGIGGNRKLWGDSHQVTAVEYDENIAKIYKDYFPKDKVIVGDAHKYLLENFQNYDLIWCSPPCPTHSRLRTLNKVIVYPDMNLYSEVILLQKWFKGLWIVENVIPYYEPIIKPNLLLHRHAIWCNFTIEQRDFEKLETCKKTGERAFLQDKLGFDVSNYRGIDKRKVLRNCVVPEMGLHILNNALNVKLKSNSKQLSMFD
jgi:DNA (cytosine-5)-methyltransferase 1